ncbi:MAG: lipopolysaccharide assembly protein LapA domain-containing protein [Bdellovibrionales bacterium]
MKFFSWLATLVVLFFALCFALNNRQSVTVSLWPFGLEIVTPLYILSLGTLFLGLLLGSVVGWISHLPQRLEARRLRRDISDLRDKVEDLAPQPPAHPAVLDLPALPKPKWAPWKTRI